jgi:hypothetical protein
MVSLEGIPQSVELLSPRRAARSLKVWWDDSRNFVLDRVPLDVEAERISILIFR